MIRRLRPAMPPDEAAIVYAAPHDHRIYGRGHSERVAATIDLVSVGAWESAADLSCGNGAVLDAVRAPTKIYGDLAPGYPVTGPVETTVGVLPSGGVDLFVLCETLEHLDDPGLVLRRVAARTRWLLLSTPVEAWGDTNREHYWAWDRAGVESLLDDAVRPASATVEVYTTVDSREWGEPYCYGIWLVRL